MATIEIINGVSRLLLGFVFMNAGGLKVGLEKKDLVTEWGAWVGGQPAHALRMIGAAEVTAGALLVLPLALALPVHLAAAGAVTVMAIMAGAVLLHLRRGDRKRVSHALALAALGGVALWTLPGG